MVDIAAACVGVGEATSGGASYFDVRVVAVVNLSSREPVVEAGAEKTMASGALTSDSALELGNYLLSFRPRIGEASWFTLTRHGGDNDDGRMTLQLQNWAARIGDN